MATILDSSIMGHLQCQPNATTEELTITANSVTTNRDFNIRIVAYNSRGPAERTEEISKLVTLYICSTLDYSAHYFYNPIYCHYCTSIT